MRIKFATKACDTTNLILGMLLHYFGKLKRHLFADIQQIWKKMLTNFDIFSFKVASLSPY